MDALAPMVPWDLEGTVLDPAGAITGGWERTRACPGIEMGFGRSRTLGVQRTVATQKPERITVEVVERFGLTDYFETASGTADNLARPASGRASPHDEPEFLGEALHRLGTDTPDPSGRP